MMINSASHEMSPNDARQLFTQLTDMSLKLVYEHSPATNGCRSAEAITSELPTTMPIDGMGYQQYLEFVKDVFAPNIRNYRHKLHFGHQRPAPSLASAAADLLNGVTNTTVSVFEAGPVSVSIEAVVQRWVKTLFDLPDQSNVSFTNGGSESALTALFCARERWQKENPKKDFRKAVVIFAANSHYSLERSARVIGLPANNILSVSADSDGKSSVRSLKQMVDQQRLLGRPILAISANAGTTSVGAFDDIVQFRAVADECGAWLHVDASHGGSAILTKKYKSKLQCIDKADSFSWNPHKLMWVSPPCACFCVRDAGQLKEALSDDLSNAHYIVDHRKSAQVKALESENLEWTLACTRQFSALKLFSSAYIYGSNGTGQRIESMCSLASALAKLLDQDDQFELFCEPEFNMVCFRYINTDEPDQLNYQVRKRLSEKPDCYLTGTEINDQFWLRAQFTSESTTYSDLNQLLSLVKQEVAELNHLPEIAISIGA